MLELDKQIILSVFLSLILVIGSTSLSFAEFSTNSIILQNTDTINHEHAFSEKFTDKRIITTYDLKSKPFGGINSQCSNWPVFSIDTPSQVTIGTEFDVILDYTFVIPDVDAGYEDPDAILEQELFTVCNMGSIYLIYPEHAEIVDAGYVHYITRTDDNWDPPLVINSGKIAYSFDNTAPQSKTITMKINEPSPFDDRSFFDISMDANNVRRYISINGDVVTLSENVPPQPLSAISSSLSVDTSSTKTWVGDYANKTGTVKLVNRNQLPQNEPPVELFADFLKEYYPDENYEEFLSSMNYSNEYIDQLMYDRPDLDTQSFTSVFNFTLPSIFSQGPPPFGFVTGTVENYDSIGVLEPVNGAKVCALDFNVGIGYSSDELFNGSTPICDITDINGDFSFAVPLTDTEGDGTTPDLIMNIKADNGKFNIGRDLVDRETSEEIFTTFTGVDDDVQIDITSVYFDYGTFTINQGSIISEVMWVQNTLQSTYDWYLDTLQYDVPPVIINWDPFACQGVGIFPGTDEIFIDSSTTRMDTYCGIPNSVLDHPDTIRHEYAHHTHIQIYQDLGSAFPLLNCPNNHSAVTPGGDSGCAWIEGWSSFVPLAIDNDPNYEAAGIVGIIDYENRVFPPDPKFEGLPWIDGINGEGSVTAALYDLVDTNNEGGDDRSNLLPDIWATFTDPLEVGSETIIAENILEYVEDWQDSNRPDLQSTFEHNTILDPIIVVPPVLGTLDSFLDDFERSDDNFPDWTEIGEWGTDTPEERNGDLPANSIRVAHIQNCIPDCSLTMNDAVNLSQYDSATLSLYRWLENSIDTTDFLKVEASGDDGQNWDTLVTWSEESDDEIWHFETFDLASYIDSTAFQVRFVVSSSFTEEVEIDHVLIEGTSADTTSPNITINSPQNGAILTQSTFTVSGIASDSESGIIQVQISIDGGPQQTAIGTTLWSIIVSGLSTGQHTIVMRATNGEGLETNTSILVTVSTVPDPPTNLLANVVSANEISLIWSAPVNDGDSPVTGYQIERNLNSAGFSVLVSDTGSISTDFLDTTLSGGDTAEYRTSAINVIGTGSASSSATATTPLLNDTPVVTISSPSDGSAFDDDIPRITFTASATDDTDGNISDEISWSSSINGMIGTGRSVDATLSVGTHNITATISDSANNTATDAISVRVQNIQENIDSGTGTGSTSFATNLGEFAAVSAVLESTLPEDGKPDVTFPDGLFSWNVTGLDAGQRIIVGITLPNDIPANSQYWKVINDSWVNATSILGSSDDGDNSITLAITDGSSFDADGLANGRISDPGGIAIISTANNPPVATNDVFVISEDNTLTVNATYGILSNDLDENGDTLASIISTNVTHGTILLHTNGSFAYTPSLNFFGADTFTYYASDGMANSNNATVSISVTPVNDPPVARNDTITTNEDTPITISVLNNDSDVDGDTLIVTEESDDESYTPISFEDSDDFWLNTFSFTTMFAQYTSVIENIFENILLALVPQISATAHDIPSVTADKIESMEYTTDINDQIYQQNKDKVNQARQQIKQLKEDYKEIDGSLKDKSNQYDIQQKLLLTAQQDFEDNTITRQELEKANQSFQDIQDSMNAVIINHTSKQLEISAVQSSLKISPDIKKLIDGTDTLEKLDERFKNIFKDRTADGDIIAEPKIPVYISGMTNSSDLSGYEVTAITDDITVLKLTPSQIQELSLNNNIKEIRLPEISEPLSHDTSQGVSLSYANLLHSQGITGNGTTIAIIDDSFVINNPEITNNIISHNLFDSAGFCGDISCRKTFGNSHGTTVAEIIVDMAPDVNLVLYTIANTVDFVNAINDIISRGDVDAINVSLGFPTAGGDGTTGYFRDGTSIVAKAANKASDAGILVTVASGNDAQRHWMGLYSISSTISPQMLGLTNHQSVMEFRPAESGLYKACLPINHAGWTVSSWNAWNSTNNDYDLFLFDSAMTGIVRYSATNQQTIPSSPIEVISDGRGFSGCLVVSSANSTENHLFHITAVGGGIPNNYISASSVSTPADAAGALTVGAINHNTNTLESFSSQGPTDTGTTKPEICGPDGVSSHQSLLNPFLGTSASAPHIAGAAALIKQAQPSLSLTELQNRLAHNTVFDESYSVDNICGANSGLVSVRGIEIIPGEDTSGSSSSTRSGTDQSTGESLSILTITNPVHGTAIINLNNTITYSPDTNYFGEDTFTYTLSDGNGGADAATVTVTVTPVNDVPVAISKSVMTSQDMPLLVTLSGTDNDNDTLVFSIMNPANGTLGSSMTAVNATSSTVLYTPNSGFSGTDSFTFVVYDGTITSQHGTISITIITDDTVPSVMQKLVPANALPFDSFGASISIYGDALIVGAALDGGNGPGSVYVFENNGTAWNQNTTLIQNNPVRFDRFGESLDIYNHTLFVGFSEDDNQNGRNAGSAYVFENNGTAWNNMGILTPDDGYSYQRFGSTVSVYNDTAILGVPYSGVSGYGSGAAYVFERDTQGGIWLQTAKIIPDIGYRQEYFGSSVAMYDGVIAVGSLSDRGTNSGSVRVFEKNTNGTWSQTQKLFPENNDRRLGYSISMDAETLVASSEFYDYNSDSMAGTIYTFEKGINNEWSRTDRLLPDEHIPGDSFGYSVSLSGDKMIVGTPNFLSYGSASSGFDSAYTFENNGTAWNNTARITPSDGLHDDFGKAVSMYGNTALVGIPYDTVNGIRSGSVNVYSGEFESFDTSESSSSRAQSLYNLNNNNNNNNNTSSYHILPKEFSARINGISFDSNISSIYLDDQYSNRFIITNTQSIGAGNNTATILEIMDIGASDAILPENITFVLISNDDNPEELFTVPLDIINERLYCGNAISHYNSIMYGTAQDDTITGSVLSDLILGYGGSDTIDGAMGNDCIYGGPGDDVIDGGMGDDVIYGGPGDDTINGGPGDDNLISKQGNDIIHGAMDDDNIFGSAAIQNNYNNINGAISSHNGTSSILPYQSIAEGTITDDNTSNDAITDDTITVTDADSALSAIIYSAVNVNATLDYSRLLVGDTITTSHINITATGIVGGDVSVMFTNTTAITGPAGFDGIINLPKDLGVRCTDITPTRGTLVSCIDIGQSDTALFLDKPARISLSGQSGNIPWFAQDGTTSEITATCNADSIYDITTQLISANNSNSISGECFIDVGEDLVIWTAHFTAFGSSVLPSVNGGSSSGESTHITQIYDGYSYMPYTDGITINTDTPRFRGESSGYDSVTLQVRDSEGILTQIGQGTSVRDDGSFQRGRTVLDDGTYVILVGTQELGTIIIDSNHIPVSTAQITQIYDGTRYVAFVDGIAINTDTPKFRGASSGISSVQVLINGTQVGGNAIFDDGTFKKGWRNGPLGNGIYLLTINNEGMELFSSTITIDMP